MNQLSTTQITEKVFKYSNHTEMKKHKETMIKQGFYVADEPPFTWTVVYRRTERIDFTDYWRESV
jgi:hypothetical protein